jgi:hypothetical protein
MNEDFGSAIGDIVERIEAEPEGPQKVALVEEAIALTDRHQEDELGFLLRKEGLMTFYAGRRPDLLLVHFAWCVGYAKKNADDHLQEILWQYRWVIDLMPSLLEISRAQIDQTWEEMYDNYKSSSYSVRPVWVLRRRLAMEMGDFELAAEADKQFRKSRRDTMSDDKETEAAFDVDYATFLQDDAKVTLASKPFFDGTYENPHFMVSVVHKNLRTFARTGKIERALKLCRKARKHIVANPKLIGTQYNHIEFLAVANQLVEGVQEFDRHFTAAMGHPGRLSHFEFLHGGKLLTSRLIWFDKPGVTLRVPEGFVPGVPGTRVRADQLDAVLMTQMQEIAALADKRHGNNYHAKQIADLEVLLATSHWLALTTDVSVS